MRWLLAVALATLSVGLGFAPVAAAPARGQVTVQIKDNFYDPQTITVPVGTTVVWMHVGRAPHTITTDDAKTDSGRLDNGQQFQLTFNKAGTFGYYCDFHGGPGEGMFGRIVVQGGAPAAPAPTAQATQAPQPTAAPPAQPAPAPASQPCTFVLGFKALHDMIPDVVGDCTANETHNPQNGDGLQTTARGLLVYRKADNWTAFTNGSMTWINGPCGLQSRPNDQTFPWERGGSC
jgi:plastocyanin